MKKIITIILFILSITAGNVYAELTYGVSQPSEAYLRYINLPPEERDGIDEPFPVDIIEPEAEKINLFAASRPVYDPRELDQKLTIRNQMNTGSCWAFSATSNLSAFLKAKYPEENEIVFSPRHMEHAVSQHPNDLVNPWRFGRYLTSDNPTDGPRNVDIGGNSAISSAYLMNVNGPVLESDMPFKNNIQPENKAEPENTAALYKDVSARVLDYKFFDGYTISKLNQWEFDFVRDEIKNNIVQYGSVGISIYWDHAYFNRNTNGYYYSSTNTDTNHLVLIVGWDDTYSKDNFVNKPSRDGAWIVQNSWGESHGDGGYDYISYDESTIYLYASSVIDADNEVSFNNRYIHDQLGWSNYYFYWKDSTRTSYNNTIFGANIFKKTEGTEVLTEVTFGTNGATHYSVYVNPSGGTCPINQMRKVATGILDFSGYKTVKLDTPVELTGTEFTVAVLYYNSSGAVAPVEMKFSGIYSQAKLDGNSYISSTGTKWESIPSDCSIKAFTKNVTPKTKIPFVKSDNKLLVSMTDKNNLKLLPNADGTYSVPAGTYNYSISIYGKENAVKGKFKVSGESKTLYAYLNPVSISAAKTALNDIIGSYGQNATTESLNDKLGKAVGSTFNFTANSDFTVTPPTDKLNGKLDGSVTLYDTFKNTSTVSDYDNIKLYKANIQRNASTVTIRGNSKTKAKLIIADYNASGALISAVQHGIDLTEGESQTIPYQNGVNTKIYLWDADRLYPYAQNK